MEKEVRAEGEEEGEDEKRSRWLCIVGKFINPHNARRVRIYNATGPCRKFLTGRFIK